MRARTWMWVIGLGAAVVGCGEGRDERASAGGSGIGPGGNADGETTGVTSNEEGGSGGSGATSGSDPDGGGAADEGSGIKLDVGSAETGGCPPGDESCEPFDCQPVEHVPCDENSEDPLQVVGLGCPGEVPVSGQLDTPPGGSAIRTGIGMTNEWAPKEGARLLMLGSGDLAELDSPTPDGDDASCPTYCNTDFDGSYQGCEAGDLSTHDPGFFLPAPLRTNDVGGNCLADPSLVGTGDCSNTVQGQFSRP